MDVGLIIDFLKTIKVFNHWPDNALYALAKKLQIKHIPGGTHIISNEQNECSLFIVFSGNLRVSKKKTRNEETVTYSVSRGEMIGETALLIKEPTEFNIQVMRDSVLLELTLPSFESFAKEHPQSALSLAANNIKKLVKNSNRNKAHSISTIAFIRAGRNPLFENFVAEFCKLLSVDGNVLHLSSANVNKLYGKTVAQSPPDSETGFQVSAWLSEHEAKYRFVIYEADENLSEWTLRCLRQADQLISVGLSSESTALNEVEEALYRLPSVTHITSSLVLMHHSDALPTNTNKWLQVRKVNSHYHVREDNLPDYGRLIRFISGRATGLVLSGGGARGFAYIGLLRALKELKINIDVIGGSSVGAIIGALHAMGKDHQEIFEEFYDGFVNFNSLSHFTLPLMSIYSGGAFNRVLYNSYKELLIEDLPKTFFCVSTNLSKNTLCPHDTGVLWKAVRASSSIPGVVPPVIHQTGEIHVDGGVLNNLPVDLMRDRVAGGNVLAVKLTAKTSKLNYDFESAQSGWRLLLSKLNKLKNRKKRFPSISEVILSSMLLSSRHQDEIMKSHADFFIDLNVGNYGMFQVKAAKELAEEAYLECMVQLEDYYDRK